MFSFSSLGRPACERHRLALFGVEWKHEDLLSLHQECDAVPEWSSPFHLSNAAKHEEETGTTGTIWDLLHLYDAAPFCAVWQITKLLAMATNDRLNNIRCLHAFTPSPHTPSGKWSCQCTTTGKTTLCFSWWWILPSYFLGKCFQYLVIKQCNP